MQSTAVTRDVLNGGPAGVEVPRPQVLVLRSCRPAQFAAAVASVRERHPDADVVALSHRGHREVLAAAGVHQVIEVPGRRFSVTRIPPALLRRLRRGRFAEIVIPQMTPHADGHRNLYRLAAAIGAGRVTIQPAEAPAESRTRDAFAQFAVRETALNAFAWVQRPMVLLMLLLVATRWPRRGVVRSGRRRVLHIISSLGVGGAQRQLAGLINRTPPDRFDIDILVLGRDDGEFSRQWFDGAVRVTYLTEWPRLVSSVFEVRRHCLAGSYDLVHTWLFMANVIGVAGARLAGAPHVIASVRNLSLWKRKWYRQWWFRTADTLSTHAADVVTVNAEALAADHGGWARYAPARIEVVPNGLEPSQFLVDAAEARRRVRDAAGLGADAVVVGTVGRLAPEKDHETFLRVIAAVRKDGTRAHGVIVGDGQLRARLESIAKGLAIDEHVTFLGRRHDARVLMAGFDVFVLTSTIEGFPNVLLEAAFLGVPSVASRVGGSPDVLPDADDLFEPGDIGAAAGRVSKLLADPVAATARSAAVRQRAFAQFTADQTAKRWFTLYDRSTLRGDVQ